MFLFVSYLSSKFFFQRHAHFVGHSENNSPKKFIFLHTCGATGSFFTAG